MGKRTNGGDVCRILKQAYDEKKNFRFIMNTPNDYENFKRGVKYFEGDFGVFLTHV